MFDVVLLAKLVEGAASLDAELGLEGSGLVVETGMNHSAVVSGLVRAKHVLGFEDDHREIAVAQQGHCGGQPDNPAADDRHFIRSCAAARKRPVERGHYWDWDWP